MNVLITGTSGGIGRAAALKFLQEGHTVYGIDIRGNTLSDASDMMYTHFSADISKKETLPDIRRVEILINNAGIQSGSARDIEVNLLGTMNVTEKYAFQDCIKSVLFNSSVSSLTGNEFPEYVASKAGVTGYMKNAAIRLANTYRATCNALCFGGVLTDLNRPVTEDAEKWARIMDVTPLKRWATAEEAADWCYFMTA